MHFFVLIVLILLVFAVSIMLAIWLLLYAAAMGVFLYRRVSADMFTVTNEVQ